MTFTEDTVYIDKSSHQDEYVLNDEGLLYYGTSRRISSMDWFFGQFESNILDIALQLLREERNCKKNPLKSLKKCHSPAHVARVFSAMVSTWLMCV